MDHARAPSDHQTAAYMARQDSECTVSYGYSGVWQEGIWLA
jgi:hypothetical protein